MSGILETLDPSDWMGDKGYIGSGMLTPIRKPEHRNLLDWEVQFNVVSPCGRNGSLIG